MRMGMGMGMIDIGQMTRQSSRCCQRQIAYFAHGRIGEEIDIVLSDELPSEIFVEQEGYLERRRCLQSSWP